MKELLCILVCTRNDASRNFHLWSGKCSRNVVELGIIVRFSLFGKACRQFEIRVFVFYKVAIVESIL